MRNRDPDNTVTLSGIAIFVIAVSSKAVDPISVILAGRLIETRDVQPLNAALPIVRTPSPIVTTASEVQSMKAPLPISVRDPGMATDCSPEHLLNAC